MTKENARNIRLGAFVIAGTILIITAFYLMGSNQNLFGSKLRVVSRFQDVGGLMKGNNVRFAGIDVGTVESVIIENDTTVIVTMVIEKDVQRFIRKNSLASVGTDGLMGNRLVNIQTVSGRSEMISDGDELFSRRPVEMDQMVRTLDVTNENIRVITHNLRSITDRISSRNSLWNVLLDTAVAANVKSTVVNLKLMSDNGLMVTGDLRMLTKEARSGKGTLGALVTDTALAGSIRQSVVNIKMLTDSAAMVTGDISAIVRNLRAGKGSLGILLTDTSLVHNMNKSVMSLDTAAGSFSENMEALHHTWPLKKYYRNKKK